MKQYLAYLKKVLRHKWYVFRACRIMQVPLYLAIVHDWTKFLPVEFFPYARQFHNPDGSERKVRDSSGAYDTVKQGFEFNRAWVHHQRNKHHWQAWVSIGNGGALLPLPMPEVYVQEMIADWVGAGMAYDGKADPGGWFRRNREHLVMHEETEKLVLKWLAYYGTLEMELGL